MKTCSASMSVHQKTETAALNAGPTRNGQALALQQIQPPKNPPVARRFFYYFDFFMRKPAGLITRVRRKSVWSSQNTKICQSGLEKTKIKYIQAKSLIHLSCYVRRAHHSEPACSFASFSCQCVL